MVHWKIYILTVAWKLEVLLLEFFIHIDIENSIVRNDSCKPQVASHLQLYKFIDLYTIYNPYKFRATKFFSWFYYVVI